MEFPSPPGSGLRRRPILETYWPLVAARITNRVKGRPLTAREKTVLEQLMLGLCNKAIARKLNLCVGTVKQHVKSILKKLDADSRTAAVVAAERRGLLR